MYPTVRNVGRGNTRCKKKVSPLHTYVHTRAHTFAACIPLPRGAELHRGRKHVDVNLPRGRIACFALNRAGRRAEWIYGWTNSITGLLPVTCSLRRRRWWRRRRYAHSHSRSGFCSPRSGELRFMVRRRCTGSKINALSAKWMHRCITG